MNILAFRVQSYRFVRVDVPLRYSISCDIKSPMDISTPELIIFVANKYLPNIAPTIVVFVVESLGSILCHKTRNIRMARLSFLNKSGVQCQTRIIFYVIWRLDEFFLLVNAKRRVPGTQLMMAQINALKRNCSLVIVSRWSNWYPLFMTHSNSTLYYEIYQSHNLTFSSRLN